MEKDASNPFHYMNDSQVEFQNHSSANIANSNDIRRLDVQFILYEIRMGFIQL